MKEKILSIVLFLGVLAPAAALAAPKIPCPQCPIHQSQTGTFEPNCQCVCTGTCPVNHEVLSVTDPPCCRFRGQRGLDRQSPAGRPVHPKHP